VACDPLEEALVARQDLALLLLGAVDGDKALAGQASVAHEPAQEVRQVGFVVPRLR
jgi:hypothetical protein